MVLNKLLTNQQILAVSNQLSTRVEDLLKYFEIDYSKAVQDGHSLGFSFPQHVLDDLNLELVEVYNGNVPEQTCVVNQTQLTRVKKVKELV